MAHDFRDRIEARFESWGRFVVSRPIPILIASLALVLICSAGLSRVRVDVTFEAFLQPDDSVLVAYDRFRAQFGRDERIIVAAEPAYGTASGDVFDLAFLERLKALHEAIEERVPYIDEVTSLVNARDTRGDGDTLRVEDFLDPWPENEEDLERLRDRARANPLFRNNVLSADGKVTTLVLEVQLYSSIGRSEDDLGGFGEDSDASADDEPPLVLTGTETLELVTSFHEVIDEFQSPDFTLRYGGTTVILQDIAASMFRDMPRFVALALFSIGFLLFLLFRRVIAVVIPLIVVAFSVTSTIGLMGWAGVPMHVPTQILPSFLLAVGVGDAVHLLSIFFERLRSGEVPEDALAGALGHSGLALTLTSLTTAAGLASFVTSGLAPVAAIGFFAPLGVMIALLLSLTLLPALLCMVPLRPSSEATSSKEPSRLDRFLIRCGRIATHNARSVVAAAAVLSVLAIAGASQLGLSHDPLSWLDKETEIVQGTRYIDKALGGSVSFEVLLATEAVGGVRQPEVLRQMSALGQSFEEESRDEIVAGQTISLADVVKEIHRALNEDREAAYAIPGDPRLISQELLLFENSGTEELEDVVDSEYRLARMTVRMPWRDAIHYSKFFDLADADIHGALDGFGNASTSGVLALLIRAMGAVVTSMATSYLLAFGVITPMLVLLLGSLRTGLIAMIPNAMPILLTLGLMGLVGFPLDAFSLLIGGIALGLAVDDTIHFMHNYRRYRRQGATLETAVETTLRTTGRAMLITTIVLSAGFLGFVLSSMNNLTNLGILVSFAVVTAFVADVLLAPALLELFDADADHRPQGLERE
jgi:predicted RND superfamily exporter protein